MREIWVLTTARSDYGILRPVMRAIEAHPELSLRVIVSGMHLLPGFGDTAREIEAEGFAIHERLDYLLDSDTPEAIAAGIGRGVEKFSELFAGSRPDILLVLGDRFDMLPAVVAALPFNIPVAHIHGGESTEGLIDESIRHAVTKMAQLHFPSTAAYAERVVQMGEEQWRVHTVGAPSLDNLNELELLGYAELETRLAIPLEEQPLLVTFHPVTLEYEETGKHIEELLAALREFNRPVVFTYPNADTGGRVIIEAINDYVAADGGRSAVAQNLGQSGYFALMREALAMVGNSSSGIIEAASFELPVVNVGVRQKGRIHGANVIDVPETERGPILEALRKASDPAFRGGLSGMKNPYGDGTASEKIAQVLAEVKLDKALIQKAFHTLQTGERT